MRVALDAGHGGYDPGAVSIFAGREKDYTLLQSHIARSVLLDFGISSFLTRSRDEFVSLARRVALINGDGVDAAVSFHWNAAGSPRAEGTLVLAHTSSPRGQDLADRVLDYVAPLDGERTSRERVVLLPDAAFRLTGSGRPFVPAVLSRTSPPVVLLEVGFGTNPGDAEFIRDPAYLVAVAEAVAQALKDWGEVPADPVAPIIV